MAVQMEVYRLLRTEEKPETGLSAKIKDPHHQSSIVNHVAYGSNQKNKSRFISACGSLEIAITFRKTNEEKGYSNGPIVKISIKAGMTFYDLRTYNQREHILESENVSDPFTKNRFHSFAGACQEVLIVDSVPPENIVPTNV